MWISASASFSVLAQGVPPSDITPGPRIQRLQQRQLDATRELNPRPNVLTPPGESPAATDIVTLPRDNPCFPVEQLVLEDDTFGWLARCHLCLLFSGIRSIG